MPLLRPGLTVVTGASSGVGAAFARALSARGNTVVLVGRDHARLQSVADLLPGPSRTIEADLASDEGVAVVESLLLDPAEPVDLLINNAATGYYGPFAEHGPAQLTETVALNATAVVRLSRAALTSMLRRRSGGIIVVSSLAGSAAQPGMATYSASKAFIDSWAASVRDELRGSGVTMTTCRPGWVRTGFHDRSGQDVGQVAEADWLTPEAVAERTLDAYEQGRSSVVILPQLPAWKAVVRGARSWAGRRTGGLRRLRSRR